MRRAARIDANQPEVVAALRAAGWTVAITSAVGGGFPDLVAGKPTRRGRLNLMIEVKDGRRPPSERELTADQQIFHACWGGQIDTINSVEELQALLLTVED